ncbi:hypothetical protein ACFQ15_06870, partial [Sphingomonas hankookensis]
AWHETDTGTGNLLHDKAGRSVCLNRRQPAPMGSFFVPNQDARISKTNIDIAVDSGDGPRAICCRNQDARR